MSFTIIQIPSKGNDFTAIVQCEMKTQSGSVIDFGTTNAKDEGTDNVEILLNRAREKAMKRVEETASKPISQPIQNQGNPQPPKQQYDSTKKQYNHNPSKQISDGQIKFIHGLIKDDNGVDRLCKEKYNCTIYELNSQQANEIIQSFKK